MTSATLMISFFRVRDKATNLLNIDRDLCHKVYNTVKLFCKPFNKYLEDLWRDLHSDVIFSADIKTALKDFCLLLGLHYNKPSEPVAHRWLSVYATTTTNLPMMIDCCTTMRKMTFLLQLMIKLKNQLGKS